MVARALHYSLPALLLLCGGLYLAPPGDLPALPAVPDSGSEVAAFRSEAAPAEVMEDAVACEPVEAVPEAESLAVRELMSLLAALDESVRLRPATFPRATLEELAVLLSGSPDAVDRLLAELPTLNRGVRSWLIHAFEMIRDRRINLRLKAALAASDPDRGRIDKALRDPISVVTALDSMQSPRDRKDLVNRLTRKHLENPGIASKLRDLVENDHDEGVRATAVYRLAMLGNRSDRSLAMRVFLDPTRHERERGAAGMALEDRAEPDVIEHLIAILRRGEDPAAILVFAAKGLKSAVGQPEADDSLFGLLLDPRKALKARQSSAGAIADGARHLEGDVRARLEERAYGALIDLEQQPESKAIYTFALSQFTDSLGKEFRARVMPAAVSQASVTQR